MQTVLLFIAVQLEEGASFSDAISSYPQVFSPIYIATVKAGEASGQLASTLDSLASYLQESYLTRQKIENALIYPILLTVAACGMIIFLLHFAVPKITALFADNHHALPLATKILLTISNIINQYGIYFLLAFFLKVIVFSVLVKKKHYKQLWHKMLLNIPKLSNTLISINETRFLRTFGVLSDANVSVCDAIKAANAQVTLVPMHDAINQAITQLVEGQSVSQSLAGTQYFSAVSLQLIASGEQSGQLSSMLKKAASFGGK